MSTKTESYKYEKLVIFTSGYPYGDAEVTFLQEEVWVLKDYFKKILIVPLKPNLSEKINELPINVEILLLSREPKYSKRRISDYIFVMRLFIREVCLARKATLLRYLRYHISELFGFLALAKEVNELIKSDSINNRKDLLYTYWFDEWSSVLATLKEKYKYEIKFVSRAHRFDIYEERSSKGYIFPRHLQLKFVDKIYSISENGENYLKKRYPKESDKITCARLGTKNEDYTIREMKASREVLTLVSCSSIIPVKRVNKIIDILKFCQRPINWIHFGEGYLKSELISLGGKLPSHITMQLMGNVKNKEITKFYAENDVDWFINVSESEGIPVSIMEAISYGIPIIATDVGGVNEIVNTTTGLLVAENFKSCEVANLIENVCFTREQRTKIIDFWKLKYNAQTNFNSFAKDLQIDNDIVII